MSENSFFDDNFEKQRQGNKRFGKFLSWGMIPMLLIGAGVFLLVKRGPAMDFNFNLFGPSMTPSETADAWFGAFLAQDWEKLRSLSTERMYEEIDRAATEFEGQSELLNDLDLEFEVKAEQIHQDLAVVRYVYAFSPGSDWWLPLRKINGEWRVDMDMGKTYKLNDDDDWDNWDWVNMEPGEMENEGYREREDSQSDWIDSESDWETVEEATEEELHAGLEEAVVYRRVKATHVNIRDRAGTAGTNVIGQTGGGVEVEVLDKTTVYAEIALLNTEAEFIPYQSGGKYLDVQHSVTLSEGKSVKVLADEPVYKYNIVVEVDLGGGDFQKGEVESDLVRMADASVWLKIRTPGGKTGWVLSDFVE